MNIGRCGLSSVSEQNVSSDSSWNHYTPFRTDYLAKAGSEVQNLNTSIIRLTRQELVVRMELKF